jgi:hypothetical protein
MYRNDPAEVGIVEAHAKMPLLSPDTWHVWRLCSVDTVSIHLAHRGDVLHLRYPPRGE